MFGNSCHMHLSLFFVGISSPILRKKSLENISVTTRGVLGIPPKIALALVPGNPHRIPQTFLWGCFQYYTYKEAVWKCFIESFRVFSNFFRKLFQEYFWGFLQKLLQDNFLGNVSGIYFVFSSGTFSRISAAIPKGIPLENLRGVPMPSEISRRSLQKLFQESIRDVYFSGITPKFLWKFLSESLHEFLQGFLWGPLQYFYRRSIGSYFRILFKEMLLKLNWVFYNKLFQIFFQE